MQLDVSFRQAVGLKHEGRHCIEVLLDGHNPQRTGWISDLYDSEGFVIKPKNFNGARQIVRLKGGQEKYNDAWLHITLIHQRTFREDKRAAEAHVPFSKVADGFTGWIALEHKEQYGGKIFLVAKIAETPKFTDVPQQAGKAKTDNAPLEVPVEEMEEQLAILASIQSSRAPETPKKPAAAAQLQDSWPQRTVKSPSAGLATVPASWSSWPETGAAGASAFASTPSSAWPDWPAPQAQQALQSAPATLPSAETKQQAPLQLPLQSRQLQKPQEQQPPQQQQQQPQEQRQKLPGDAKSDEDSKVLPEWLDWQHFLSTASEPDRHFAGSASIPTGVQAAAVQDATATATGRKRALLVGLNYPGTPAALKGSVNDVASMSRVLLRLGFQEEWTLKLTDDQADPSYIPTRKNLMLGMRWLTQGVVSGDALFFHFSGHGVQQADADADQDALDDALCPADFSQAGYVTENEVFDCLVRKLPSGVRLTILIDSCLPCICPELPFIYELQQAGWAEENPWHSAGDVICISTELDEIEELRPEKLQELRDLEEGLITSCFLQAIQELAQRRAGPVTYWALISEVQKQLKGRGFQRQVRLSASQAFKPDTRPFRFFDALENSNPEVGLRSKKIHRSHR